MYEGLGHKCAHLLPLITEGTIKKESLRKRRFSRILGGIQINFFGGVFDINIVSSYDFV